MKVMPIKTSTLLKILVNLLIIVGYMLLILPTILDEFSRIQQNSLIQGYTKDIDCLNEIELANAWKQCEKYNEKIANEHKEVFYHYSNENNYSDDYLALPFKKASKIASIIIPKIDLNLPIAHGTDEITLQNMVGHLYGTSFPSGGSSSHSVLSAHTALRTSKMFDRIVELNVGDEIYINILDETHVYEVIDTLIINPDEHDRYLQVEEGKDLITLYTCYPYGINTHRLLVKAERVEDFEQEKIISDTLSVHNDNLKPILKLIFLFVILVFLINLVNKFMAPHRK